MLCVSEGCGGVASCLAADPDDPTVILPLCAKVTCMPLAVQSGFEVWPMPERKSA